MKPFNFIFIAITSMFLLTGCPSVKNTDHSPVLEKPKQVELVDPLIQWNQQQDKLRQLRNYQIRSTVIFETYKEKPTKLKLFWQKKGSELNIRLFDVLGRTQFQLDRRQGRVTIIDQNGQMHTGNSVDKLIEQLASFAIPVSQMENWIIGLPSERDKYHLSAQMGLPDRIDNYDTDPYWYAFYNQYNSVDIKSNTFNSMSLPVDMEIRSNLADSISLKNIEWSDVVAN